MRNKFQVIDVNDDEKIEIKGSVKNNNEFLIKWNQIKQLKKIAFVQLVINNDGATAKKLIEDLEEKLIDTTSPFLSDAKKFVEDNIVELKIKLDECKIKIISKERLELPNPEKYNIVKGGTLTIDISGL